MDDPLLRFKCLNVDQMVTHFIRQSMRSGMKCETLPSDATIVLGQKDNTNSKSLNENTKIYRKVRYEFSGSRQRLHSETQIEEFLAILQTRLLPCTANYDLHSLFWVQIKVKDRRIFNDPSFTYEKRIGSFACPNGKVIFCRHPADVRVAILKDILNLRPNRGTSPGSALYEKSKQQITKQQPRSYTKKNGCAQTSKSNDSNSKTDPETALGDSKAEEVSPPKATLITAATSPPVAAAFSSTLRNTTGAISNTDPPPRGQIPTMNNMAMMISRFIPHHQHPPTQGVLPLVLQNAAYPGEGVVALSAGGGRMGPPPGAPHPNDNIGSYSHPPQGGVATQNMHMQRNHSQEQHPHYAAAPAAGDGTNPSLLPLHTREKANKRGNVLSYVHALFATRDDMTFEMLDKETTLILGQMGSNDTTSLSLNLPTRIYRDLRHQFVLNTPQCERQQRMEKFMKYLQRTCAEKIPGFPAKQQEVDCWVQMKAEEESTGINALDDAQLYDNRVGSFECPSQALIYCRHPKSAMEMMLKDINNWGAQRTDASTKTGSTSSNKGEEAVGRSVVAQRYMPQGYPNMLRATPEMLAAYMRHHAATQQYFMTPEEESTPSTDSTQKLDQLMRQGATTSTGGGSGIGSRSGTEQEERRPTARDIIKPVIRDTSTNPLAKDPPSQEDIFSRDKDNNATTEENESKFWDEHSLEKWGTTVDKVLRKAEEWVEDFVNGGGDDENTVAQKRIFGNQFRRDLKRLERFRESWKMGSFDSDEHKKDNESFLVKSVYRFRGDMMKRYNKHMKTECLESPSNDGGKKSKKRVTRRLEP